MVSSRLLFLALRLGLFQACLGALAVLTLGIFNRLLIDDFQVPAVLTALALGCQQLVAFTRVWFGKRSDQCRWGGLRRTPFILGGAIAFCLLFWLAGTTVLWVASAAQAGDNAAVLWRSLLLAFVFLLYGTAISASSTPFAALLVDITNERERPALVSVVWSMLTVGIVVGAIVASRFLGSACASSDLSLVVAAVRQLTVAAPLVIFGLILLAVVGVEPPLAATVAASKTQELGFGQSIKLLRADPQVSYFFCVLCLFTFSLFLQEAVLEPYGGAVFNMTLCETTRLNALWGMGTLVGIASTGFLLVPRLGPQRTALAGGVISAIFLVAIAASGALGSVLVFKFALVLFGYGAGVGTNACLTLMLGLTSPQLAGTFIGLWGLAQAYSRGFATVAGGGLLSLFGGFFGNQNSYGAYASVFLLQAIGLLLAGILLLRVDTALFQQRVQRALGDLLALDLDA
ncbi:BCD family MFS transporter [Synechococcus sp. UW140]|uniref:BCD family MFS transporter n=1 Tax=Synechococcus sp. UW140 TaxID=368503 RepID=UPI0025F40F69|nr:BCD family MFS transporter [Synechococcus sp. UW140]